MFKKKRDLIEKYDYDHFSSHYIFILKIKVFLKYY